MHTYLKAEHFYKNHGGLDGLIAFIKLSNTEPDLKKLGMKIHLSPSQACRLRGDLMELSWKPKRGTIEFLEFIMEYLKKQNQEREIFIKEESNLKLIVGKY